MSLYPIVLHLHSVLRYVVLALLLWSIMISMKRFLNPGISGPFSLKIPLFTLIAFHTQFLIGLLMYILSPKVLFSSVTMHVDMYRFFTMEHSVMMLLSVILITLGYSLAKRNAKGAGYRQIFIYNTIALIIVLVAIPWPFRHTLGSAWF